MDTDICELKCIAVLGGTFNPVHMGHIKMAECALREKKDIEKLIFMPNNIPAYKDEGSIISTEHRLNMLKLAIDGRQDMQLSLMEIERGGVTYTADTLDELHKVNPRLKIYFIVGTDSLVNIRSWHRYRDVLNSCTLLVYKRNIGNEQVYTLPDDVMSCADIEYLNGEMENVSSSLVRELIGDGKQPCGLLPVRVMDYIRSNGLYEPGKNDNPSQG